MRKQIVRVAILLSGLIFGTSKTYSEYWSEFGLKKTMIKPIYLDIESQGRFKSGVSDIYYFKTEVGPILKVNEFMEVGFYYVDEEKKGEEEWQTTNTLSLYENFSIKLLGLHLSDRNRFDYEDFEFFKYRNLLKMKKPFVIYEVSTHYGHYPTIWRIIPCVQEEIFYDFKENNFNENRLLAGVSFEIYRLLDFRIAGMLQSQRDKEWTHKGSLVTTLQLNFLEEEN